ncbi:MAG TPA: sigma-70 family RNA polymerase sigma factor [Planctomycetota bacterium]|nr:sigma-70 family RNA polymerase sigma factor [Planctomycetota bacterium]
MDARDPEALLHEVAWLRRLAHRLVTDDATADDLAGDTLAEWSAVRTPPHSRRGWLATVLRHRAERHHRREQLRARAEQATAQPACSPPVDDSIAKAQLHRDVVDAVLALREPYRSAVVLRYLDDLPLHEVAERLHVPTETARTRIKRGLEHLRQRLDHRYGSRAAWTALLLPPRAPVPTLPFTLLMATKPLAIAAVAATAACIYLLLPTQTTPTTSPPANATPANQPAVAAADLARTAAQRELAVAPAAPAPAAAAAIVVRGRTVDETTSLPLADVRVVWYAGDAQARGDSATTGRDGHFTFRTTAPSPRVRPVLLLRAPGHALTTQDLGSPSDTEPDVYDVGDVLMPPGTALSGTVVDSDGVPAGDTPLFALLFAYWTNEGRIVRLEEAMPVGRTDADGSFRLDDRLLPNRPDPVLLAAGSRGVGFAELTDLHRDRTSARADIRLLPGTELQVRVVDELGAGVPGALVVAEPRFVPLCLPGTFPIRVETVPQLADCFAAHTGADGLATLHPLALQDGDQTAYTLRVEGAGRDRSIVPIQLPHTAVVEVVLPRSRPLRVHGHVRDAAARPIADVRIAASWTAAATTQSGDDGGYSLALSRGDGPLQLDASARAWFPQHRELQPTAADDEVTVDFELSPALELSARIVDQHGKPVARALAWLVGGDAQGTASAADGTLSMAVPPAAARVLHVWPPDPSTAWAGGIDHLLAPGQNAVTLVLERLPRDRSSLEVEVVDAQGSALEPARVALQHEHDRDSLWHPATAIIGHITASDLPPGDWSLLVEPTQGCELLRTFTVPPGGDTVHLRLVQPLPASAHGEVVLDDGAAAPPHIELTFRDGSQRARFVAAAGQQLLTDGHRLRLDPRTGLAFTVVDIDASRPLAVVAESDGCSGDADVRARPTGDTAFQVHLRPQATMQLRSAEPFASDRVLLQLRRPDAAWAEPMRCEGLGGRTELIALPVTAGAWEWRLQLPTRGDDNRAGACWQHGTFTVLPGATAIVDVRERE